jgi:cytochrome P450
MQDTSGYSGQASGFDPFELSDTLQATDVPDPYPYLATARRRAPVVDEWPFPADLVPPADGEVVEPGPSYCVLGHDEVVQVLRDHETFSSTILQELMGPLLDRALIAMDEPMHQAHRALVAPAFRPKLLSRWRDELVGRVVTEVIESFVDDGRADLVRRLTFAFPVRVIARILGLPDRDSEQFQRWSIEMISVIVNWERGIAASEALRQYFAVLVAERRQNPRDDLISEPACRCRHPRGRGGQRVPRVGEP